MVNEVVAVHLECTFIIIGCPETTRTVEGDIVAALLVHQQAKGEILRRGVEQEVHVYVGRDIGGFWLMSIGNRIEPFGKSVLDSVGNITPFDESLI